MLGGWDQWDAGQGIAIGARLAEKLGVTIGDPVTIVNPNGTPTPFGKTAAIRSYPVNVIFNLGMPEFDSFHLYMPMQAAQVYFKLYEDRLKPGVEMPGVMATDEEIDAAYERAYEATGVEVFVARPDDIRGMRDRLQAALDRPFAITDWQQRNATFFSALQVERVVMFVILSLIILVAAFNIIASLVMLVKDKGPDIAVLRTMGATRGAILRIFAMTGFAIGLTGTILGLILGLVVAANAEAMRAAISNLFNVAIFPPELFLLSELPSRIDGDRGGARRAAVARPHLPRDALSGLARGAARSGRGAQPMSDASGDPGAFSRFEFMVAWRYLRARRRDRFVSVIAALTLTGIALGVAALIVVTSVMNGFNAEIINKLLGLNGHFSAYPIESRFTDYEDAAAQLERVQGVTAAIPYVEGQALASGPRSDATGVIARGVTQSSIEKLKLLRDGAILGHWDDWDAKNGVAIGRRLAEKLGVNIGDPVTLVSPNGQETPNGRSPQIRSYPVQVIFDLGMTEFDSFYLYMPLQGRAGLFQHVRARAEARRVAAGVRRDRRGEGGGV